MMRRMRRLLWLFTSCALVACTQTRSPPTPPASAYEGPSSTEAIGRATLEDEVLDTAILEAVLDDAGFVGGVSRLWSPPHEAAVREVEIRALRFSSPDGAASYLEWIRGHPQDMVGGGTVTMTGDRVILAHEPGGCCPGKDTSQVVAAWADRDVVWVVRLGGPQADIRAVQDVADAIGRGIDGA